MNQGPWFHLEGYTAAAANAFERVWVTAGTIFDKEKAVGYLGEAKKGRSAGRDPSCVVQSDRPDDGRPDALTLVFEQAYTARDGGIPKPSGKWVGCRDAAEEKHVYRHRPRLVALAELEARTGLSFFAGSRDRLVVPPEERPAGLWEVEKEFWSGTACAGQRRRAG